MALVNCGQCGKSVSDRAPSCPQCGVPLHAGGVPLRNAPSTVERNPAAYGLVAAIFMLAFMWIFMGVLFGFATTSWWWPVLGAVYGWYLGAKHANAYNARIAAERNVPRVR